ncbi:hypothetical protein Tco_1120297 [Tanacetum coccineum]
MFYSVPCKSKAASVPAGSRNSSASVPADRSVPAGSRNSSASVPADRSDLAASRNRPAVNSAGRPNPAGWSKRPATVSAGRLVSAGWLNPAARPYFRPSSVNVNNMYWPDLYDPMSMTKGREGTAVKTSAGSSQNWLGSLKCIDVVVAGSVIQTIQAGLRESYECLASAPIACTARQMVFSSPWLTAKKESGSPLQTALVCNSNPLIAVRVC